MSGSPYMPKSKSDTHITPDRVYDMIEEIWGVKKNKMFDPCPENFTVDGLSIPWKSLNYVNPPYSLLTEFVGKALLEQRNGNQTIMLLLAKTDQEWFHDIKKYWHEIVWIRRRLKFKNNKHHSMQSHFLVCIS